MLYIYIYIYNQRHTRYMLCGFSLRSETAKGGRHTKGWHFRSLSVYNARFLSFLYNFS